MAVCIEILNHVHRLGSREKSVPFPTEREKLWKRYELETVNT